MQFGQSLLNLSVLDILINVLGCLQRLLVLFLKQLVACSVALRDFSIDFLLLSVLGFQGGNLINKSAVVSSVFQALR